MQILFERDTNVKPPTGQARGAWSTQPAWRRWPVLIVFAAVLLIGLFPGGSYGTLGALGAREDSEDRTVRVGMSGNPDTLDPHRTSGSLTFFSIRGFYDTLIEPGDDGAYRPALAEDWEVSDDGLAWTFELRPGVLFHHGRTLQAEDVVATFERMLDPEVSSPHARELRRLERVEAVDELTVRFELSQPHTPLLATLASGWGAILPADLIEAGHRFSVEPIGTGPYLFTHWREDNEIRMSRNPQYWSDDLDAHEAPEEIVLRIISETTVQEQALIAGQLDIIDMVSETMIDTLDQQPDTQIDRELSSLVMVLAMNNEHELLGDTTLRRAIAHSINKQQVLDVAYNGGRPVSTFLDYGDPFYAGIEDPYPYDPERARELVEDSRYNGERLRIAVPQNYEPHVRAAEIYTEMLAGVGLNVELRLVEWSTWLSDVYQNSEFDLTVIGHTGKLDPDGRFAGFDTGDNYVNWYNSEAEQLIEQARGEAEFDRRFELYSEVQRILAEEVPMVFVGTSYRHIGLRANIREFHMDPKLDTIDFYRLRFE